MIFSSFLGTFCFPQFLNPPYKEEKGKIDIVIEHMQQNIMASVSLKDLASLIFMSPSHFSAMFKNKTGHPPLEYFNHLKIQRACQYLEFTAMPVKELCYELGLDDPFYFSRLFRKYMGESPLSYRKRKRFL
ncbi:helix-turn-helix transcriptional regulator [Niabella ginsengisoli]|uniref:AraC family transcriptional regulator n=1 Tax=Niabella ginsengisoli TaxID=522298 RepID=A0ABS9SLT9_9BACT|nr:AraC family transcriptional regulator [Niabella ginsengisoli]MCH5599119.1 AraC family transcriptional regulator [Niabella ginsengisoli]